MTMQTPFFGKRSPDPLAPRSIHSQPAGHSASNTVDRLNTPVAPAPAPEATSNTNPVVASQSGAPTKEGGSKLTVGPNIKLKGVEITDCDTLVVEGTVEATMDSRVMHITEIGAFKGAADIDFAEIYGEFNGDLTVRQKLVIYSTGRVNGKVRYGSVVIQEGGQLMGDVQFGTATKTKESSPPKMGMLTAA